jgi:hypothetical protein
MLILFFLLPHRPDARRDDDFVGASVAASAVVDWLGTIAVFCIGLEADRADFHVVTH